MRLRPGPPRRVPLAGRRGLWRPGRMRVMVVGNCQAPAIATVLARSPQFRRRFALVHAPAVHEIRAEDVPELHVALATVDVALLQLVGEEYRDGIGLGTETLAAQAVNATVVRFPSLHWNGYMPSLTYLRSSAGLVLDGPFDYHDEVVLRAWADGAEVPDVLAILADAERPSQAPQEAEAAFERLADRAVGVDLDVVPFIRERHREELLFHVLNHPTDAMLGFIASAFLRALGVTRPISTRRRPAAPLLGHTFYPLHPADVRALGLRFADGLQAPTAPYRIRGRSYAPAEAIRRFLAYYDANRELALRHFEQ